MEILDYVNSKGNIHAAEANFDKAEAERQLEETVPAYKLRWG